MPHHQEHVVLDQDDDEAEDRRLRRDEAAQGRPCRRAIQARGPARRAGSTCGRHGQSAARAISTNPPVDMGQLARPAVAGRRRDTRRNASSGLCGAAILSGLPQSRPCCRADRGAMRSATFCRPRSWSRNSLVVWVGARRMQGGARHLPGPVHLRARWRPSRMLPLSGQ